MTPETQVMFEDFGRAFHIGAVTGITVVFTVGVSVWLVRLGLGFVFRAYGS